MNDLDKRYAIDFSIMSWTKNIKNQFRNRGAPPQNDAICLRCFNI